MALTVKYYATDVSPTTWDYAPFLFPASANIIGSVTATSGLSAIGLPTNGAKTICIRLRLAPASVGVDTCYAFFADRIGSMSSTYINYGPWTAKASALIPGAWKEIRLTEVASEYFNLYFDVGLASVFSEVSVEGDD